MSIQASSVFKHFCIYCGLKIYQHSVETDASDSFFCNFCQVENEDNEPNYFNEEIFSGDEIIQNHHSQEERRLNSFSPIEFNTEITLLSSQSPRVLRDIISAFSLVQDEDLNSSGSHIRSLAQSFRVLLDHLFSGNPNINEEEYIDSIIAQLVEQDGSSYGPPPASKMSIKQLEYHKPSLEVLDSNCCICLDKIKKRHILVYLPCQHFFHKKCGRTWLKKHCTCPICRYELPTDDPEFEKHKYGFLDDQDSDISEKSALSTESVDRIPAWTEYFSVEYNPYLEHSKNVLNISVSGYNGDKHIYVYDESADTSFGEPSTEEFY